MLGGRAIRLGVIALVLAAIAVGGRPALRVGRHEIAGLTSCARWGRWRAGRMPAGPEGWIRIPAIRLYAPLAGDLETGACAFDGLGGSRVIVAHRDRHFRPLSRVAAGQTVCVDSADGSTETFRVVECEVLEPDAVARRILDKRGERWLVLMTCHPFSVLGPAPGRFLVWAAPVAAGR